MTLDFTLNDGHFPPDFTDLKKIFGNKKMKELEELDRLNRERISRIIKEVKND